MKPIHSSIFIFLTVLVAACVSLQAGQTASVDLPTATPQGNGMVVEVSTAVGMPLATLPAMEDDGTELSSDSTLPTNEITFLENGSTIALHVGESFVLKLDMDGYDWTVDVDNQDILHREIKAMSVRGAQGIYIAEKPGTAKLTANGDPLCLQSKPPCMRPSIWFGITVIVE